jgi:hypothetical protein
VDNAKALPTYHTASAAENKQHKKSLGWGEPDFLRKGMTLFKSNGAPPAPIMLNEGM